MRILKFGGTSVATAERIQAVVSIVTSARARGPVAVVVSALGGVTDELDRIARLASTGQSGVQAATTQLRQRHEAAAHALADVQDLPELLELIGSRFEALSDLFEGFRLVGELSPSSRARVLAHGELLCAPLVVAGLKGSGQAAHFADARDWIRTCDGGGASPIVDEAESFTRIRRYFESLAEEVGTPVIPGFVASDPSGATTTLGRGGSDHSASLIGAALAADAVELWTDVDGVMSADPRVVENAVPLKQLSYVELAELSHFGAKVVHPASVHPTRRERIPLWIRNSFRPEVVGTRVSDSADQGAGPVRGISSISNTALLRLEGDGMVGIPGIAMRLFGALARRDVSVILISQASSEHSICFAVAPHSRDDALDAVRAEFEVERSAGRIDQLVVDDSMAVVAIVGEGMRRCAGLSGRLFATLGANDINVHAIAQGSSERNLSFVVAEQDERRAVNVVHDAFFLAGERHLDLFVAGVGGVGSELLEQLGRRTEELRRERGLRIRLVGAANSRHVLFDLGGLDPCSIVESIEQGEEADALDRLAKESVATRVFVDCTASAAVGAGYDRLLAAGVHVVTANKLRLAGDLEQWRILRLVRPGRLYFETTVGAGLPVLHALTALLATGDRVHRIEGVFSGTVSHVMAQLREGSRLSDAVRRAADEGFTEPDPREDLGGVDVARKLVILSRVAQMECSLRDVALEPLVEFDSEGSLAEFWKRLTGSDADFGGRLTDAATAGRELCYLASATPEQRSVRLLEVDTDHPCAGLRAGENVFAFYTDRYCDAPLVVRGPGAGRAVTAAGVFADILRAADEEGTP